MATNSNTSSVANMPSPDTDQFSRISEPALIGTIFLFLAIAVAGAAGRTFLRVKRFKKLAADDVFLSLAVVFMSLGVACVYLNRKETYLEVNISAGLVQTPSNAMDRLYKYKIWSDVTTVFVWASLFSVKFSFMLFFRKLVDRVRHMKLLWCFVFGTLCVTAPLSTFWCFYICSDFAANSEQTDCTGAQLIVRENVYLVLTTTLDIFTDLLIISVPCALLWNVNLSLRRKLGLLSVLSLSAFMITIAIVRVTLAPIPVNYPSAPAGSTITDTVWLFFWQAMESAVAIIMVSTTAFRSMIGQTNSSAGSTYTSSHHRAMQAPRQPTNPSSGDRILVSPKDAAGAVTEGEIRYPVGMRNMSGEMRSLPTPTKPIGPQSTSKMYESDSDDIELLERNRWEKGMKVKTQKAESFV